MFPSRKSTLRQIRTYLEHEDLLGGDTLLDMQRVDQSMLSKSFEGLPLLEHPAGDQKQAFHVTAVSEILYPK